MAVPEHFVEKLVENAAQQAPAAGQAIKAAVAVSLGGVSLSLQDINTIMSITAAAIGIVYSLHLLTNFWWTKFWKDVFIRRGWYDPRKKRFFPGKKHVQHHLPLDE